MTVVERETVRECVPVTTADVLNRAADLLEEFGWCRSVYAVDSDGTPVDESDRRAVRFCARGATHRAAHDFGASRKAAVDALYSRFSGGSVTDWNDAPGRTKAEVVAKLREAARDAA